MAEMPLREIEESIIDLFDQVDRSTSQFGAFHPRTLGTVNRLVIALWKIGEIQQAGVLLDQAIEATASSAPFQAVRYDLLCTLAEFLVEQERWERAAIIYRELLQNHLRPFGSNHARFLAAKGDLAGVLFELGETIEAAELEEEALEAAKSYLGRTHAVTCVLAWNRAIRLEESGDGNAARILVDDLLWLLAEEDANLEADHRTVKTMLAERLRWQTPRVS